MDKKIEGMMFISFYDRYNNHHNVARSHIVDFEYLVCQENPEIGRPYAIGFVHTTNYQSIAMEFPTNDLLCGFLDLLLNPK